MYHGQGRRGQQKRRAPELLRSDHVPSSRLDNPADLERLLAGNVAGVTGIYLGSDFGVNDGHLHAIGLKLGSQLLCMELGSSDTGDGARVSCAGVQQLVAACPNLIKLKLEAVTEVDNRTFHAVLSGCPNLESLTVTGHDKRSGALKGAAALKPLVDGAVPGLRRLYITDQTGVPFTAVEKLIKARGATLQVQAGQTDSDSMAHSMVLQAMGANYGDGLYGNYY